MVGGGSLRSQASLLISNNLIKTNWATVNILGHGMINIFFLN